MSRNTQAALDSAVQLSEGAPAPDGFLHTRHLFGGLLTQRQSYAYQALQATLGASADLDQITQRYVEGFLREWRHDKYSDFLRREEQPSRRRDAVEWVDDAPTTKDLCRKRISVISMRGSGALSRRPGGGVGDQRF